jgi:hypothetical protein
MLLGLAYTAGRSSHIHSYFSYANLFSPSVVPVFWFTKPELGGFGFSPLQISVFLGMVGISQAIWLLLIFPPLQHRFGTGGVLRGCSIAWPVTFMIFPICNILLRQAWGVVFWSVAPVALAVGSGVSMAFSKILSARSSRFICSSCPLAAAAGAQLALNDIAPSPSTLGTLNALALTLHSALRMIAPALFSSIFATGVRTQFLNGYLVWVVLVLLSLGLAVTIRSLPEKAEGKLKSNNALDRDRQR